MTTGIRQLVLIALFAALVACVPLVTASGTTLNFVMMALYATLIAQAWNILGGFGGQFSFGHALFFGTGAYIQAIAQLQGGINAWVALPLAVVGARAGRALRRRAELPLRAQGLVLRARHAGLRRSVPHRRAVGAFHRRRRRADGAACASRAANLQFGSRSGYLWLVLAFVTAALLVTWWLRNSRFGACLQAVRDNEDAARAVGVNPFSVKLAAIGISGAFMGAAGAFYVQVFQYIDPGIAYGPATSVEALVAAIVGGMGTLWGPVLGALVLHLLSDLTRNLFGELPGINMVIYGVVLVLIVIFVPRGIAGIGLSARQLWAGKGGRRG